MKKIPIYIFIVIILVGLFSPIFNVHASTENPNESCDTGKPPTNLPCVQPYALLEPLPGMDNTKAPFYPSEPGALGTYLNIAIKIFIGLCAVLAVVMIVIGGIEYSTSELVSSKEAGKDRIRDALLGLLLALGAYLILFTINPDLLNTEVGVDPAIFTVEVKEFVLTPEQTGGDPSIIIPIGAACEKAKALEAATGVDRALILAIFKQESSGTGKIANTGDCNIHSYRIAGTKAQFQSLLNNIPKSALPRGGDVDKIQMSCWQPAYDRNGNPTGHGGAIGFTQILINTWSHILSTNKQTISGIGHQPNPWELGDSLLMGTLYLKELHGDTDPAGAACHYFSGPGGDCNSTQVKKYVNSVLNNMKGVKC